MVPRLAFSNSDSPIQNAYPIALKAGWTEHNACHVNYSLTINQHLKSPITVAAQDNCIVWAQVCAVVFASCMHKILMSSNIWTYMLSFGAQRV
jgi:hypothetical protein